MASTMAPHNLKTGDPERQYDWHETFRDNMSNIYRTSYQDMVHGREVSVKNDLPAGYGGHIPSLRHDMLFRNTAFDRRLDSLNMDVTRDTLPSFLEQKHGIPAYTAFPRGRHLPPTAGTVPNVSVKPPWALTLPLREPPTFRTVPNSARLPNGSVTPRLNTAAKTVGQAALNTKGSTPRTPDRLKANLNTTM
eukprot:TRINITY_DN111475_c0_g1_i1.p1 TRINITY_DN111475_c0_g1~~TRINITY_DN111475_c0_g1_i1.p1  ORF type:complete len:192 (-),score=27.71 TRINITY_DN111475_c0_g1_i1:180-755(-)